MKNSNDNAILSRRATPRTIQGLLGAALSLTVTIANATAPHAVAPTPSTVTVPQDAHRTAAEGNAGERGNWNVDYPSQLAPLPLATTNNETKATQRATASTVDSNAHGP